jgi:CheY-like chemotaxis protein
MIFDLIVNGHLDTYLVLMPSLTYLLIDDDADDLETFAIALENASVSCRLVTAKNGQEALDLFRAEDNFLPDFVFIDLNMPFMNGKQLLAELKSSKKLQYIPAIIYTTSSHPKDIEETRTLGAAHFLVKPSSIDRLTKLLTKIFNKQPLPFFLNEEIKNLVN